MYVLLIPNQLKINHINNDKITFYIEKGLLNI